MWLLRHIANSVGGDPTKEIPMAMEEGMHSRKTTPPMDRDLVCFEITYRKVIGEVVNGGDVDPAVAAFMLIAEHAGEGVYEFTNPVTEQTVRVTVEVV